MRDAEWRAGVASDCPDWERWLKGVQGGACYRQVENYYSLGFFHNTRVRGHAIKLIGKVKVKTNKNKCFLDNLFENFLK